MSWLTEIAGKAEDLLNRVDKTAATALQNKQKSPGYKANISLAKSSSRSLQSIGVTHTEARAKTSELVLTSSARNTVVTDKKSSYNRSASAVKKKPVSDDEKLFQFLNSSDPAPINSPKKSSEQNLTSVNKTECGEFSGVYKDSMDKSSTENITETDPVQVAEGHGTVDDSALESIVQRTEPGLQIKAIESENDHFENISSDTGSLNSVSSPLASDSAVNTIDDTATHSLQEELLLTRTRAEHAESEMKRMQKKLEHWNSQISGNDKFVRELQERETDLTTAIDAKDSQLAVLKVRLQEADQEIYSKKIMIEQLKVENERITKDNAEGTSFQNQALDNLRENFLQTETELMRTKEAYHAAQNEHMQRMSKMEEEQRQFAENVTNLQKKWTESNERNKELISQLKNATGGLDSLHQEYTDYKQKAQRILQSKEKLIGSLKEGNFDSEKYSNRETSFAVLSAEAEGIKQERDLLREELRRGNEMIESYRSEVQELEKMAQNDSDTAREHCRNLEEQLHQEMMHKEEIQLLSNQLKEELQFLREDLMRTKNNLQTRVQDREIEIEKLRKQLTAKSLSTVSQDELESRLHALTENLIQKQTIVEALSTEKNSLVLQLERLEQQLKEAQVYGSQHHTVVGVSNTDSERKQKSAIFLENPFDSTLTRKVKRMYGNVDAFSIRLGVFFRRYPIARVFIIVYMLLLHLWVMIVLLTYEPEIHNSSFESLTKN